MNSSNQLSKRPNLKHIVSVDEHGIVFLDGQRVAKNARHHRLLLECPICHKHSASTEAFKSHIQSVHNGARIFKCKFCKTSFDNMRAVNEHIRNVHVRNLKWECTECGRKFTAQGNLTRHMATHSEKLIKCRHCSDHFTTKSDADRHARRIHLRARFHCSRGNCTIRFLTEAERQAHINVAHEGFHKGYKCELCWMSFLMNEPLQRHYANIHPNSLKCQLCPEKFNRNDEAADHLRERHGYCEGDDEWLLKIATENAPTDPNTPWVKAPGSV